MWKPKIRHEIEYRASEDDWIVKMYEGKDLVQVAFFNACNSALSWVERREESYSTP